MASLKSLLSRVTSSDAEVEAQRLRQSSQSEGSIAACDCTLGSNATIKGVVRSMILEPSDTLPSLEATVFDGTGTVKLVWMGQRRIIGVDPGRRIRATGRVSGKTGEPVIYNPRYELLPAED
ncbi:MAG: OB-fold nucleic acid binding domain-containing protein [Candidatus Nanopelagicales bacterium]